jgi:hypothetical protein
MRNYRRLLGQGVLAAGLLGSAGCLSCLHTIDKPQPATVESCKGVPLPCRRHVYVFLLNGADPLNKDNLSGVRDYLIELGFHKTWFGHPHHVLWFRNEICRVRKEDPEARIAVVGFSCSAAMARRLVRSLGADGVRVDLLVYLGGDTLEDLPRDQPRGACRIVNIRGDGCLWFGRLLEGCDLGRAENYHLCGTSHACLPSDVRTLEILTQELLGLACSVPYTPPDDEAMPPALEEAPTPRPVPRPQQTAARDEWDFLKPVARLGQSRPEPAGPQPPAAPADAPARDAEPELAQPPAVPASRSRDR